MEAQIIPRIPNQTHGNPKTKQKTFDKMVSPTRPPHKKVNLFYFLFLHIRRYYDILIPNVQSYRFHLKEG